MVDLYALVEQSIAGMDVELVDVERAGKGLLRVTIDREGGVRIEDCETVSRHLSRVFEVENIDYSRLEVGSPGTDRRLRNERDFIRFAGERADIRLHEPFEGRRTYTGTLLVETDATNEAAEAGNTPLRLGLQFEAKQGEPQVLHFTLDEVERAKLNPVLDFKGKKR